MKKIALILLLFISANSFAHFMWIETNPEGKAGKKQEIKVFFGEYTYGVIEKVHEEAFGKMKDFEVWVINPAGQKQKVTMQPGELFYSGWFEPKANGTYTIVLNNDNIDVIDYTQYDFGIFKTHYHATAKVEVGNKGVTTAVINTEGLAIADMTKKVNTEKSETMLKVFYKGEPVKEAEVTIFISDLWSKKLYTNENGEVRLTLPWKTKYIAEVTCKEEVPGTYNGKEYQFIWHCATYTIPLSDK